MIPYTKKPFPFWYNPFQTPFPIHRLINDPAILTYESGTTSITRLRAFRHYQDVCAGRMVTAKNEFLDNGGNIGYIEVFTRPPSQEP
ncbi:hypothetical protein [Leptospira levettii]|uniref:hypothetical protein n=1 Tax=Leptospira levettii TaxID=2023178 RepID=UPI00223CAD79|nr:hypothetical protein [Leptospira levettii]MCW7474737.1 hypothetical protein [Leptospira levettii]